MLTVLTVVMVLVIVPTAAFACSPLERLPSVERMSEGQIPFGR